MVTELPTILGTLRNITSNFDLVSFDPRGDIPSSDYSCLTDNHTGISFSTPSVTFFHSDADRSAWDFSTNALEVNSTSPSLQIPRLWARSQALGYLAEARDNGIFAHVTTDNVARDMWSMAQAYNQTKLQYYGFSWVGSFPLILPYIFGTDMELFLERHSRPFSR